MQLIVNFTPAVRCVCTMPQCMSYIGMRSSPRTVPTVPPVVDLLISAAQRKEAELDSDEE